MTPDFAAGGAGLAIAGFCFGKLAQSTVTSPGGRKQAHSENCAAGFYRNISRFQGLLPWGWFGHRVWYGQEHGSSSSVHTGCPEMDNCEGPLIFDSVIHSFTRLKSFLCLCWVNLLIPKGNLF